MYGFLGACVVFGVSELQETQPSEVFSPSEEKYVESVSFVPRPCMPRTENCVRFSLGVYSSDLWLVVHRCCVFTPQFCF